MQRKTYAVRAVAVLIVLLTFIAWLPTGVAHADIFFEGRVYNSLGVPVSGAEVQVSGAGKPVTTDASGSFMISALAAVSLFQRLDGTMDLEFLNSHLILSGMQGKKVSLDLYNTLGRHRVLMPEATVTQSRMMIPVEKQGKLDPGVYILRISLDGRKVSMRILMTGSSSLRAERSFREAMRQGLAKAGGQWGLGITAAGYQAAVFQVEQDTSLGLSFTLYGEGVTKPAQVSVTEQDKELDFQIPTGFGENYFGWLGTKISQDWSRQSGTKKVKRTFKTVILDNGVVRVVVAPDLGMRVIEVTDKSAGSPREMFQKVQNPVKAFHVNDIGGVKPSFPLYEHGTRFDSAGYFIRRMPDGGVDVVMNMRFNYNQTPTAIGWLGNFDDRTLSSVVSLKPGQSMFTVRYVADNPNPLRRNNRIWNVALFPTESRQVLFPTKWETSHGATILHDYQKSGLATSYKNSLSHFAVFPKYSFCGFYYSGSDANHLRIADPVKAPGMKLYDDNSLIEFWGSTNPVFEAPDKFVAAFEPNELEQKYYIARGIGKAAFANEFIAIGISEKTFKVTAPVPSVVSIYEYGSSVSPILADKQIGPGVVLSGTFSQGLRVVSKGVELCNVKLPLEYEDNSSLFAAVKEMSRLSGGTGEDNGSGPSVTSASLNATWGMNYELEGAQNKWWMMNSLASLRAVEKVSASDPADILLSMANTAYRHGGFEVVNKYIDFIGSRSPEGTKYLQALMAWEEGRVPTFTGGPIEAKYFEALLAIKGGDKAAAISHLNALLKERPNAVRPRLVRAYLQGSLEDAMHVLNLVPGSVELWTVLAELGYRGASDNLAGLLKQNKLAEIRKNDFLKELKEGKWRHERRFEYKPDMFTTKPDILPTFPSTLKY